MGGDAYSASAVLIKKNGSWNLHYICRDYLGSITQMTDRNGTLLQEMSYDAWGRLRNPNTLVAYLPEMEPELLLGRGYTGHEHLTMFGLVNMNARLYDPAVGRFLSPDPYVQVPDFTQSYNRFSYAMNNPLMYVDADGENPLLVLGLVIGAYIGGVATNRGELNPFRWNYSSITTYLGLGFGALVGYYGAYGIVYPGSISIAGSIGTPWISAGTSVAALGQGTDWQFNFQWTTAGGGGGRYGHFGNAEVSVDKAIANAQSYYYNYHTHSQGSSLDPMAVLSTTLSGTSEVYYSKHFGTWMGKDFKVRSQSWGGNQYTGGKNQFALKMSKKITWGGNVLGIYNGVNIYLDWDRGNSSSQQFLIEEFSNIYSTVGGVYGAAWGIGWEMGRQTTYQAWYQQLKYRFWYNRMENLIGPPSETNKIYWDEFYKNYRP